MHERKTNALTGQTRVAFEGRLAIDVGHHGNLRGDFYALFWLIVSVHVLLFYQVVGSPEKTTEPKECADDGNDCWTGPFCMMWLHWPTVSWQMLHFAYFCCGHVETQHTIYLWLNSPHEPSHRWEQCSHTHFAFWRGTHFKIIIWALHCSGFTV